MDRRSIQRVLMAVAMVGAFARIPAAAQTSASYKLQEASLNNGGDPIQGVALASAHFHLSLDAIGDPLVRMGLGSASFHMDWGFVGTYPPPGEVTGVQAKTMPFSAYNTILSWQAENSAGNYEVYRGLITSLPGSFGTCFASNLASAQIQTNDTTNPSVGQSYFYLVTSRNRLGEEGTKGYRSNGTERPNPSPCP